MYGDYDSGMGMKPKARTNVYGSYDMMLVREEDGDAVNDLARRVGGDCMIPRPDGSPLRGCLTWMAWGRQGPGKWPNGSPPPPRRTRLHVTRWPLWRSSPRRSRRTTWCWVCEGWEGVGRRVGSLPLCLDECGHAMCGDMALVSQFRPPINKQILEIPAGLVDEGEVSSA